MASPTAQDAVNYARRFPCSDAHARYIAKNYLLNHGESLNETLSLIEEANAIISGESPVESMPPIGPATAAPARRKRARKKTTSGPKGSTNDSVPPPPIES